MNNIIKKTMKMNKTATKLKPGMTLIEITVVILVLLTLIAVLFIGANIYKKGADRAACILNIRNIHQAVRADQNLDNEESSDRIVGTILEWRAPVPTSRTSHYMSLSRRSLYRCHYLSTYRQRWCRLCNTW